MPNTVQSYQNQFVLSLRALFNVRSKTFWGLAILIFGIAFNSLDFYPNLPESVKKVAAAIAAGLVFFGWFDSIQSDFTSFRDSFKGWVTRNPGIGFLINLVFYLFDNFSEIGGSLPSFVSIVVYSLGAFLMAMGMRNEGVIARQRANGVTLESRLKNRHLLVSAGLLPSGLDQGTLVSENEVESGIGINSKNLVPVADMQNS